MSLAHRSRDVILPPPTASLPASYTPMMPAVTLVSYADLEPTKVDMTDIRARNRVMDVAMKVAEKAKNDTVPRSRSQSQLSIVAFDLSKSVCEAARVGADPRFDDPEFLSDFIDEQSERVRDILASIPSAFHHWSLKTRDGKEIMPFEMSVVEMGAVAKDIVEMKPDDLSNAFGAIWTHVRALSELRPEAQSRAKRDLCLHAQRDGVEYVSRVYLESEDFVSPLLEWAIVDALVFDRIMEFASTCSFTGNLPDTPQGQLLDGPLLPGTGSIPMGAKLPGWLSILGSGLGEIALTLAGEVLALTATWWISYLLAGSEGLGKWILFTGATAARWVSAAIRGKGDAAREKLDKGETNLRMLWDMGIVHERVPAMNVELLRHLLYRLEERGAAFSPAVYAILDKRARREARQ